MATKRRKQRSRGSATAAQVAARPIVEVDGYRRQINSAGECTGLSLICLALFAWLLHIAFAIEPPVGWWLGVEALAIPAVAGFLWLQRVPTWRVKLLDDALLLTDRRGQRMRLMLADVWLSWSHNGGRGAPGYELRTWSGRVALLFLERSSMATQIVERVDQRWHGRVKAPPLPEVPDTALSRAQMAGEGARSDRALSRVTATDEPAEVEEQP